MAAQTRLVARRDRAVLLRLADPESAELLRLGFRRYPDYEWGTLALFGWRETNEGLILTLAELLPQQPGDLNEEVGNVAFMEPYTLRTALHAEKHRLAVGVIHSHPRECPPIASRIDDEMDTYFADYFSGFAPGRPYVSLIVSEIGGESVIDGRVFWRGRWSRVSRVASERAQVAHWGTLERRSPGERLSRTARLAATFGDAAAARIRASSVAVIGAGGTGSIAIEVLARAGVGRMVIVDPDSMEESNLERMHGSVPADAARSRPKVEVARDHVRAIDSKIRVDALVGALPQPEVVDAVVGCDVALGCTDKHHSRLALAELAYRYLLPAIDTGVAMEGAGGQVTGQCIQLVRFLCADPCATCSRMISFHKVTQELMPEAERAARQAAARAALDRNEDPNAYWRDEPQINTVGYVTSAAGSLAAGYAIGWLTGRFDPPFSRLQVNLSQPLLDTTDDREPAQSGCACRSLRGWADQGAHGAVISPPPHWPPVRRLP